MAWSWVWVGSTGGAGQGGPQGLQGPQVGLKHLCGTCSPTSQRPTLYTGLPGLDPWPSAPATSLCPRCGHTGCPPVGCWLGAVRAAGRPQGLGELLWPAGWARVRVGPGCREQVPQRRGAGTTACCPVNSRSVAPGQWGRTGARASPALTFLSQPASQSQDKGPGTACWRWEVQNSQP